MSSNRSVCPDRVPKAARGATDDLLLMRRMPLARLALPRRKSWSKHRDNRMAMRAASAGSAREGFRCRWSARRRIPSSGSDPGSERTANNRRSGAPGTTRRFRRHRANRRATRRNSFPRVVRRPHLLSRRPPQPVVLFFQPSPAPRLSCGAGIPLATTKSWPAIRTRRFAFGPARSRRRENERSRRNRPRFSVPSQDG